MSVKKCHSLFFSTIVLASPATKWMIGLFLSFPRDNCCDNLTFLLCYFLRNMNKNIRNQWPEDTNNVHSDMSPEWLYFFLYTYIYQNTLAGTIAFNIYFNHLITFYFPTFFFLIVISTIIITTQFFATSLDIFLCLIRGTH